MRRVIFSEGEFYHLYNRGVDKRVVFTSPEEYRRFLVYLYLLNTEELVRPADVIDAHSEEAIFNLPRGEPLVAIGAFCLMPNHLHLLATPLAEGGISKFMQRVQTAYTMYFNVKHDRSGALFQGTFKAEHAGKDPYLKYLYSYIHLNPATLTDPKWKEKRFKKDLNALGKNVRSYPYSSLQEYMTSVHRITNPAKFPNYFSDHRDIETHIDSWLQNNHREV